MSAGQFSYIWEYTVDPDRRSEFLGAYNPVGDWAKLMSRHPGYLGTKLLEDVENNNRFVTIDYWVSQSDRDAFREQFKDEFDRLDRDCEEYTTSETFLGDFSILANPNHSE